jgi:ribonuclease E
MQDGAPQHAEQTEQTEYQDGETPAEQSFDQPEGSQPSAEGGDGSRRRRRRGRRGGRRHRRNGDENGPRSQQDQGGAPAAYGEAAPTFGDYAAPAEQPQFAGDEAPAVAQQAEPSRDDVPPPTPSAGEAEGSRRGSTIREPASFTQSPLPPAPSPAPVVSSTASEDAAPPKRGWWGRRLMGDKS